MKKMYSMVTPIIAMASIPLLGLVYIMLNHDGNGAYSLMTDIDRELPFVPIFVLPYVFWYLYIPIALLYICYVNKAGYYKTLILYNIGLLICMVVYHFFQTTVPRPILVGDDLLTSMISFVYQMDQPFNCFPSIHVFTTYLLMRSVQKYAQHNFLKVFVHIVGALIILSTIFIKQHVILDGIASIILVEILHKAMYSMTKEGITVWKKRLFSLLTMSKKYEA